MRYSYFLASHCLWLVPAFLRKWRHFNSRESRNENDRESWAPGNWKTLFITVASNEWCLFDHSEATDATSVVFQVLTFVGHNALRPTKLAFPLIVRTCLVNQWSNIFCCTMDNFCDKWFSRGMLNACLWWVGISEMPASSIWQQQPLTEDNKAKTYLL